MPSTRLLSALFSACLVLLSGPAIRAQSGTASYDQLKDQLGASSAQKRQSAATWLGQMGDTRAMAPLIEVLERDKVPEVRAAAARALGVLRSRGSINALHNAALRDPFRVVRDAANEALAQIGKLPALAGEHAGGKQAIPQDPEKDPRWQTGRTMKLSGILVTSIGGGLGLLLGALGAASYVDCKDNPYRYANDCDGSLATTIVGTSILALSVGAGVPLWVLGSRRMQAVEQGKLITLLPQVNVALTPRRRVVTLRWQF